MIIKKDHVVDENYIKPKQAEKKFRIAQELQQTIYLYGITGSGKTTFVSTMLQKKSYYYYSAMETNAEQLQIEEDDKYHIVVIDDMQEIIGEHQREAYAERIRILIKCENIWLILISRARIPQWLMPLYVENTFLIIKEEDIQFDQKGQTEYFKKCNINLSTEQEKKIWQIGHGNPLLLHFIALANGNVEQAMNDIWKYFFYIYDQWDTELQEFILKMSVVERFDIQMAQIVTGMNDVYVLIKRALETGNFLIEKDGMYEYNFFQKECFQIFLEKKFDANQIARLYYNAGHMYEIQGDIINALKMYKQSGDKNSIFQLLIKNARHNPANGYYFELREYYFMLPEEYIYTSPILMAAMSILQSMLMNTEESERWYHLLEDFANKSMGSAKREAKSKLFYLDIALPHRGSIKVLDVLKNVSTLLREGKVILPEFSVTSNLPSMMNGGKDFCEWSKKDKELADSVGKLVEFVLGKYGKGLVNIALAESYLEKGMDNYEITFLAEKGQMQAEAGGKIEQIFVSVGILIWLSILNGHADDAEDILESFKQRAEDKAPQLLLNINALQCRIFLYQGKITQILEWVEEAPNENKDFCTMERFRYLTKIRVYIQFKKYDKAYALLQKMLYYAKEQKRDYIIRESMLLLAVVKYRMKKQGWELLLQECIKWAEEYHFVRILTREGGILIKLFKEGNFTWQDEEFHKQVLNECKKVGQYYPSYLKGKAAEDIVLSENALNILRLQAEGYKTEQIAKILDITTNTVKYHNKETYRKFGVSNKAAAVNEAKNRGLI